MRKLEKLSKLRPKKQTRDIIRKLDPNPKEEPKGKLKVEWVD